MLAYLAVPYPILSDRSLSYPMCLSVYLSSIYPIYLIFS